MAVPPLPGLHGLLPRIVGVGLLTLALAAWTPLAFAAEAPDLGDVSGTATRDDVSTTAESPGGGTENAPSAGTDGESIWLNRGEANAQIGPDPNNGGGSGATVPMEGVATGVVATAAVAGGGFAAWKLLAALYTRIGKRRALKSPIRSTLMEAMQAKPGRTVNELSHVVGTTPNNVRYHLSVLMKHGFVRKIRVAQEEIYLPMTIDPAGVKREAALASSARLRALMACMSSGERSASDVVQQLMEEYNLPRSSAWHLIQQAEAVGLVGRREVPDGLWLRAEAAPTGAH